MKAIAQIDKLESDNCKHIIVRNLSRILNIKILEIDLEKKTISIVYDSLVAVEKVKNELKRIGYPLSQLVKNKSQPEILV